MTEEFKQRIVGYFSRQPEVLAVYLFGSHASGSTHARSDLDLAVLCDVCADRQHAHRLQMKYFRELSRLIPKNLDIVILNRAGELLTYEVLNQSKLLYDRDATRRTEFEARRIVDYLDFAPMMRRMEQGMLMKLKERVGDG